MATDNAIPLLDLSFPARSPSETSLTALPGSPTEMRSSSTTTATATSTSTDPSLPVTPQNTRNLSSSTPSHLEGNSDGTSDSEARKTAEKKLVRKLDTFLFPCLLAMCLFQAVDRASIGVAKLNGIENDLKIEQSQFNFALSIFQIGYGLFQIPSNLLIVHPKVHPGTYLTFTCLAVSISSLCHAFVQNYGQLLTVRFLLGVFDAPTFVGTTFLLSCWYTKREMALRMGALLVGLIFTLTFLAPIAAGIINGLKGVNGWNGWRWVYIIFGSLGVGVAAWGGIVLPGCPSEEVRNKVNGTKAWWLSEQEYALARSRIEEDRVGEQKAQKGKIWLGLKDALRDIRVWVFVVMVMSRKSFEGLWNYELTIIESFHIIRGSALSEETKSLLLSVGPATFAGLVTLLAAYSSDRRCERSFHIAVPLLFAGTGLTVFAATMNSAVRYTMMFLFDAGELSGTAMVWAWVPSTIQETPEKKAVAIAVVSVLGGLGAVASPFAFRSADKPGYRLAFGILAGCVIVDLTCVFVMRRLLQRSNRLLKEKATVECRQDEEKLYVL